MQSGNAITPSQAAPATFLTSVEVLELPTPLTITPTTQTAAPLIIHFICARRSRVAARNPMICPITMANMRAR